MRTVFVTADEPLARQLRERITLEARKSGRLPADVDVGDWSIVGSAAFVQEKIAEYRETLKVTHLIATRLRIGGIAEAAVRASVEQIPGLVAGRGGADFAFEKKKNMPGE
jgi:alkanesulfonate monooxygenase SsuD/methylene tetrahydromethanopterin reductase-like flavin-dependent oxidoreductase (luciferase family)